MIPSLSSEENTAINGAYPTVEACESTGIYFGEMQRTYDGAVYLHGNRPKCKKH